MCCDGGGKKKERKWIFLLQSPSSPPISSSSGFWLTCQRFFISEKSSRGLRRSLVRGPLSHSSFCLFSATGALLNSDFIPPMQGARFVTEKNTNGGFIHMDINFTLRCETGAKIVWLQFYIHLRRLKALFGYYRVQTNHLMTFRWTPLYISNNPSVQNGITPRQNDRDNLTFSRRGGVDLIAAVPEETFTFISLNKNR